nr:uncharacterized protein LOC115261587 [Aedes albopictus]
MGKGGPSNKRRADGEVDTSTASKRLLQTNKFAPLAEETIEKKERLPPFYTRGFPENFGADIDYYVKKGLKVSLRRCTDGYKITVPAVNHYRAVEALLNKKQIQYFTHDMEAEKPYKAIVRGLDDMDPSLLEAELKEVGLEPLKIFKIRRHNTNARYRDQLYLIHFPKKQTSMSRCSNCGEAHPSSSCVEEEPKTNCVNCNQAHPSTSRSCPKRSEFIQFRKQVQQRNRRPKKQETIDLSGFPELQPPKRPIPVLEPLTSSNTQRKNTQNGTPPGFWGSTPSSSFQQGHTPSAPPPTDGLTQVINQLASLVTEMQKMVLQMMQFFLRCNIQPQNP